MKPSLKPSFFSFLLFLFLLPLFTCSKKEEVPPPFSPSSPFPPHFLWGTATAGFQVEAGCLSQPDFCVDPHSDWYEWVSSREIYEEGLVSGDPITMAPGFYEFYPEDFRLSREVLHNNAFRLSLEWSRIFTEPTDGVPEEELYRKANPSALAYYHAVLQKGKELGLKLFVNINHYTLPLWIHQGVECHRAFRSGDKKLTTCSARGWLDRERIQREFSRYAWFVGKEFGDKVDLWATLNEPFAIVLAGYLFPNGKERSNPPGIQDDSFELIKEVVFSQIEGSARAYDALKRGDTIDADGDGNPAQVGIVLNLTPFKPQNPAIEEDRLAVEHAHYLYNQRFLEELVFGNWDENLDGKPDKIREDLKGRLDFVGINYYTRVTVQYLGPLAPNVIGILDFLPTQIWETYPKGIYEMAKKTYERYKIPIYITENGAIDPGDETGPRFLIPHLAWVRKAIYDGVDLRGYFYWTHMDNYEWNQGLSIRMGLFAVDPVTKARKPKPNASIYGEMAKTGRIPPHLLERYGGENLP